MKFSNQKPKVFVGTPSSDYPSRNNEFFSCIKDLKVPPGSDKKVFIGDAWSNIDAITKEALDGRFTHIFFIDDDQTFDSNILLNLLRHEKEVVSGLYLLRHSPFPPALFDDVNEIGSSFWVSLDGPPRLIEVERCGMGCLLIETEVYKKLQFPYYRMEVRNGMRFGCDILFSEDIRKAGYKIYADTSCVTSHSIKSQVKPVWNGREWETKFKFNGGEVTIPCYARDDVVVEMKG